MQYYKGDLFRESPIVNVDRWAWARTLWRWHNEWIVDCLADESRRMGRKRSQRGKWRI